MKSYTYKWMWLLIPFFIFVSCKKNDICNPSFQADKFVSIMQDSLNGKVMGYGFIVTQNGQVVKEVSGGLGRASADGQTAFNLDSRMQIASVSKTVSTVMALKVLQMKNLPATTLVNDYLPDHWAKGIGINNLTFLDFIAQQAGLNIFGTQSFSATLYDSLQMYIRNGATQPKVKMYTSTHHAMMRVTLPRLWNKYKPLSGTYDEDFCSSVFQKLAQELVFDPIGIFNVDFKPPVNNPFLAYSGPSDNSAGSGGTSDFINVSGGTGMNLSVRELAKFHAFLWFTQDIINNNSRQVMIDNLAGYWNTINGANGAYLTKLGKWNYSSTGDRSFNSAIMHFPDNVQLTVITNSVPGTSLRVIGQTAYDNSFGCN